MFYINIRVLVSYCKDTLSTLGKYCVPSKSPARNQYNINQPQTTILLSRYERVKISSCSRENPKLDTKLRIELYTSDNTFDTYVSVSYNGRHVAI